MFKALTDGPHAHPTEDETKVSDCGSNAGLPGSGRIEVVDVDEVDGTSVPLD